MKIKRFFIYLLVFSLPFIIAYIIGNALKTFPDESSKYWHTILLINIGYSLIASCLFFIFQYLIPTLIKERKALSGLRNYLIDFIEKTSTFLDVVLLGYDIKGSSVLKSNVPSDGVLFFKSKDSDFRSFEIMNEFIQTSIIEYRHQINKLNSTKYFWDLNPNIVKLFSDLSLIEIERFYSLLRPVNPEINVKNLQNVILTLDESLDVLSYYLHYEINKNNFVLFENDELAEYKKFISDFKSNEALVGDDRKLFKSNSRVQ